MIKNSHLVYKLLYKNTKKHFPRAANTQPNTGIHSTLNKLSDYNSNSINSDKNMLRVKKRINDELEKNTSDEDEEDIDEKFNQSWGKKEPIELDPYYTKYFDIAKCNEKMMEIPEEMQHVAHKVFSKHLTTDVRHWTRKFLLNYSQN